MQSHKIDKGQQKGQTKALLFILKVCSGRGTLKLEKGSSKQGSTLWLSNIWHVPFLLFQGINIRETWFWKVSTGLIKHVLSHFQREPEGINFAETSAVSGHGFILRIFLDNR